MLQLARKVHKLKWNADNQTDGQLFTARCERSFEKNYITLTFHKDIELQIIDNIYLERKASANL